MATCYSLPSASWARLWQTPWAHTVLPGMAGSLGEQDLLLPGELPAATPHAMGGP